MTRKKIFHEFCFFLKKEVFFLIGICPLSVCLSSSSLAPSSSYTFHIFIYFSRTNKPSLTKLGTKHSWVKTEEDASLLNHYPRGGNCDIIKKNGPISTQHGTKHPWVKGVQFFSNKEPRPFPRGDNSNVLKIH